MITRRGGTSAKALITTDKKTLIDRVTALYGNIKTFNATVDLVPALGSADKGEITEYKDVRAYILFRQPTSLRMIGLFPVVRNKAFDMVSDGVRFLVHLPSKNRLIEGANDYNEPSPRKIENLRPQHFLESLLVAPVEPGAITFIEDATDEVVADYILHIVKNSPQGEPYLARNIWFDRQTLRIVRQKLFDTRGRLLTDARYDKWQSFDGVPFPKHIEINRPRDEYAVVLDLVKMEINRPMKDEQFVLERPAGVQVQVLGAKPESRAFTNSGIESGEAKR
ncbi:MAG: DUF4292 domain-containing protein [Bryobacteraceae bacterium]